MPVNATIPYFTTSEKDQSRVILYLGCGALKLTSKGISKKNIEVEVEVGGVKKTLTSARMEIVLMGVLEIDPEKRFAQSNVWQNVRDFFLKYILKQDVETIWYDELRYRIYKLHDSIKKYLDMQAKGNEYAGYLGDSG